MIKYDHDSGRIYDPTNDETIGYLDAQPKSRGLRMAAADDLLAALEAIFNGSGMTGENMDLARAAISKARGES